MSGFGGPGELTASAGGPGGKSRGVPFLFGQGRTVGCAGCQEPAVSVASVE